jgi:amino acid adenylation domain-containing protein
MVTTAASESQRRRNEYLQAITAVTRRQRKLPPVQVSTSTAAPLSAAQQWIWEASMLDFTRTAYLVPIVLRVNGTFDAAHFSATLIALQHEQPTLRARLRMRNSRVEQYLSAPATPAIVDVPGVNAAHRLALEFVTAADDPRRSRALEAAIFRASPLIHYVALRFHHIFIDGTSLRVLAAALADHYRRADTPDAGSAAVDQTRLSVIDVAEWERDVLVNAEAVNHTMLPGPSALRAALPYDRTYPTGAGVRVVRTVDAKLQTRFDRLAGKTGVTPAILWLALTAVFLARATASESVAMSLLLAGRFRTELSSAIGCFITPLEIAVDELGGLPFNEVLACVHAAYVNNYRNHADQVQPHLANVGGHSCTLMYRDKSDEPRWAFSGARTDIVAIDRNVARSRLQINVSARMNNTLLKFEYDGRYFSPSQAETLADRYLDVVSRCATWPERTCLDKPLTIGPVFVQTPLAQCTERAKWSGRNLLQLWPTRAGLRPPVIFAEDKPALTPDSMFTSYPALRAAAGRLAGELAATGVEKGDTVALRLPQGRDYLIAVLATLLSGAAFVPLDPAWPEPYCAQLAAAASVTHLINSSEINSSASGTAYDLATLLRQSENGTDLDRCAETDPDAPACVIFTSGSTGQPKAVELTHRNIANRLHWMWARYPYTDNEICMHKTNPVFVDSLWEIFGGLLAGVPTVLTGADARTDVQKLARLCERHAVTRLTAIPAVWELLLAIADQQHVNFSALRIGISSGEVLHPKLISRFFRVLPRAHLLNLYGASETSGDATCHECQPGDQARPQVPIGVAIDNTVVDIVDAAGTPQPAGIVGEITVSGAAVARGYREPRAARAHRAITLRTGDLGRRLAGGEIEYLGRGANIHKVNGIRVNLGYIETTLCQDARVRNAAVVSDGDTVVAFCVADAYVTAPELAAGLRLALPTYAIPEIRLCATLPTTSSGKTDQAALRTAIRALTYVGPASRQTELPTATATGTEAPVFDHTHGVSETGLRRLVQTAATTAQRPDLGADDHLLEIGLNSLTLMRIALDATGLLGHDITLGDLLQMPTLSALYQAHAALVRP